MAIKSHDDEFGSFGRFDRDLFGQMERMFDEMRSMYGFDGRRLDDGRTADRQPMDRWTGDRRMGTWGDAATSLELGDGEYVFVMDLPGFEREDIDLTFADGRLSVAAVHEGGDDTSRRSRRMRNSVRVPADVREAEITAAYRNGVLEVHLPIDADDVDEGRHIDIQG